MKNSNMWDYFKELWSRIKVALGVEKPISRAGRLNEDDIFNAKKQQREKELNRILEKINTRGVESLSKKEKEFLDQQS